MAGLLLAAEDRAHFLALMRRQTNSAVHRRINALLLLDDGWTAERAGEALFIDADTVRAHKQRFLASGRAGIGRLDYAGHAPVLTQEQSETLAAELVWRFYQTAEEVCGFVAARFGLGYTLNAMAKLLNCLGFAWKSRQQLPNISAEPLRSAQSTGEPPKTWRINTPLPGSAAPRRCEDGRPETATALPFLRQGQPGTPATGRRRCFRIRIQHGTGSLVHPGRQLMGRNIIASRRGLSCVGRQGTTARVSTATRAQTSTARVLAQVLAATL